MIVDDEKNNTKPRIKPVSRITQSKYARLKNSSFFPEIDRRLRLGWGPNDLARAIHEEFNEFRDTSVKYLVKLITRYRDSIPTAELAVGFPSTVIKRATDTMTKGLNELDEIERLYQIQMDRIEIDYGNEKNINKLLPNTGNEIAVAMKLLNQSANLKMDLGLIKRQVGAVEVNGQLAAEVTDRYKNDTVGKIISDPDARKKVLNIAERLLAIGAKVGMDAASMVNKSRDPIENDGNVIDIDVDQPVLSDGSQEQND